MSIRAIFTTPLYRPQTPYGLPQSKRKRLALDNRLRYCISHVTTHPSYTPQLSPLSSLVCRDCHRHPPLGARFGRRPLHPCAPPSRVFMHLLLPHTGTSTSSTSPNLSSTGISCSVILFAALCTTLTSTDCATGWRGTSKLCSRQCGLRRLIVRYWHLAVCHRRRGSR